MSSRKRTPGKQPTQEVPPETTTAVAEQAAAPETLEAANDNGQAANDNRPSFAERVGQRTRTASPDPFGIAGDYVAGVRLFESKRPPEMAIKFNDKPGQAVREKLTEAGYRWNQEQRVWTHPVRPDSAMTARIE